MKRQILNQYYFILLILILSASVIALSAQGVTTSSLSGTVSDMAGEPLIGANVVAIHLPSGTVYGTSTDVDGTFNFANMRVGGPYKVTTSYTGFGDRINRSLFNR
jgi:hypothetical protein